ncbi:MAG: efflux RND transporter periplasmic adaptor subunit [Sphingobium sp.]|nr:efflux RND transporter periplasmic adaptor subunit [Sphingobium sp.]
MLRTTAALCAALCLSGCGSSVAAPESGHEESLAKDAVVLTAEQIAAAGITLVQPSTAGVGAAIEAPALLESDPDATRIVAANISGRIVALTRNLGDPVSRGDTLAIIESREVAALQGDVERAKTRLELARTTRDRDEALYAKGFRPLREVEITRAAYAEAEVALREARQQVSATGARGGGLNRIVITAPISGRVIARSAVLGQGFSEDSEGAELFRVASLDRLNVALSVSAEDAARIRVGGMIDVTGGGRRQQARIRFISPVLDEQTRLVRVIAVLDNRTGLWRAGEPVQARIRIAAPSGSAGSPMIPVIAVQDIENRPVVFVRTKDGFRVTPVTLGQRDGALVAVTQGLDGGETLAAQNSFTLKAELGKGEAGHED